MSHRPALTMIGRAPIRPPAPSLADRLQAELDEAHGELFQLESRIALAGLVARNACDRAALYEGLYTQAERDLAARNATIRALQAKIQRLTPPAEDEFEPTDMLETWVEPTANHRRPR